jgi:transcriptional regulator with XRE-family HTH domain
MNHDMSVGQRIRFYRQRRGLSRVVLAGLIGKSTSWLVKVERGERVIDKVSVLQSLANVLKIGLGDLIGGVELAPNGSVPLEPPKDIHTVRSAVFAVRTPDRETSLTEITAEVLYAERLFGDGSYEALAQVLPGLIGAARAASAEGLPDCFAHLAKSYRLASGLARNVGERELALICADRALTAAQHSGDAILVAACVRILSSALSQTACFDEAAAACSNGADAIAPTDETSLPGWSLWGSLKLSEAVWAIRADDVGSARRALRAARVAAGQVGAGRNDYWEAFGLANVDAHEIAVALEVGDPVEALRVADHLEVEELPYPERRARVVIDVAQAHWMRQNDESVVAMLLEAERHAPEAVRYSVKAREMIWTLLHRERKSRTPQLRGLAERMRIAV